MKVYVLMGHVDWEGSEAIGVYSSLVEADAALRDYQYAVDYHKATAWESYSVEPFFLNNRNFP
jgi:hypothetical protein